MNTIKSEQQQLRALKWKHTNCMKSVFKELLEKVPRWHPPIDYRMYTKPPPLSREEISSKRKEKRERKKVLRAISNELLKENVLYDKCISKLNKKKNHCDYRKLVDLKWARNQLQAGKLDDVESVLDVVTDPRIVVPITTMYQLVKAESKLEVMSILLTFYSVFKEQINASIKDIAAMVSTFMQEHTMQDGWLETIDNMTLTLEGFFNASIDNLGSRTFGYIKELYYFLWGIILNVFPPGENPSPYVESMMKEAEKTEYTPFYGLTLLRGLNYVLRRGILAIKTKSVLHFFHEEAAYSKWLDECYALDIDKANINSPDKSRQVLPTVYVGKCERLIAQGKEIASLVSGSLKKTISAMLVRMMQSKNEVLDSIHAQQMREAPFAVLLNSKPKFAKSTFASILHTNFAQFSGLPPSKDSIYNRNFRDQYWSGYNTSKWCVILDDIANENPNRIGNVYESSTSEVIQVINNVAYMPNMASLDEKGKTICMPKFVIGTTNTSHLNDMLFNNAYAVHRRFKYVIDLEVKEEFRDDTDDGFDPAKVTGPFPETGDILDIWNIRIFTQQPAKSKGKKGELLSEKLGVKPKLLHTFSGLCPFLVWFKSAIDEHNHVQQRVMEHDEKLENIRFCMDCQKILCTCDRVLQAGVEHDYEYHEDPPPPPPDVCDPIAETILLGILFFQLICHLIQVWGEGMLSCALKWATRYAMRTVMSRAVKALESKMYGKLVPFIKAMLTAVGALIMVMTAYIAAGVVKGCISLVTGKEEPKETPLAAETPALQGSMMSSTVDKYYCDLESSRAFDFGRKTLSWKGLEQCQVVDAVGKNVVYVRTCGTNRKFGNGLFIGGNILVANHHLFHLHREFEIIYTHGGVGSNMFHITVSQSDIFMLPDKDLMFMRVRQMPNFKSLQELFPKTLLMDLRAEGRILTRAAAGNMYDRQGVTSYKGKVFCRHADTGASYSCTSYSLRGPITKKGDCGSCYLAHCSTGPVLLGLHQSFESVTGIANCCVVLQDDIELALNNLGPLIQGGFLGGKEFPLSDLSMHSVLRRIEEPACSVFGSTGIRFPSKTKVQKTLIYDDVIETGVEDLWSGPVFTREAWINAMKPLLEKGDYVLDLNLMDQAASMYIEEAVQSSEIYDQTKILTLDQAVNGIDGIAFIDKIKRSTSAGFPYCKSKKSLITLEGDKATPHPEIMDEVERLRGLYANSERGFPIFMGTLKDEVLKRTKVLQSKTRLFTGSPFAFSVILRQYYLPLVATIQQQPQLFEAYVGVNAMGEQWCALYDHLTSFGKDRICAGDYQAFDKTMCPAIVLKAFEVLIALAKKAGYTDEECNIMRVMSHDVAFPMVNLDGDIVMVFGMNPSGHPLTVTINCVVNCILLRMAFIYYNPGLRFKDYVHLATYGDDNIFGVKEGCKFDHTLLASFLRTQGIIYTMADKEAVSVPFVNISESTFLKRGFVYSAHHRCIVGPLEKSSIYKSLLYVIPSSALCAQEQLISQISSALIHLSLGDKSEFDKWRAFFCRMVTKYQLEPFLPRGGLFTWETLLFKFLNNDEEIAEEIVECREMQGGSWTEGLLDDIRFFLTFVTVFMHFMVVCVGSYLNYYVGDNDSHVETETLVFLLSCYTMVVYICFAPIVLVGLTNLPTSYIFVVPCCMTLFGSVSIYFAPLAGYLLYRIHNFKYGKYVKCSRELQCGILDDVEQCYRCGYDDCLYPNAELTQCPRCKRCRFWEPIEDDVWFLGCVYCESEFPMSCDMCLSPSVEFRIRLDTLHNLFYCAHCYNNRVTNCNGKRKRNPVYVNTNSPRSHDGLPVDDDLTLTRLMRETLRNANTILNQSESDPTRKDESSSVSI
jgi:hypothetical protein